MSIAANISVLPGGVNVAQWADLGGAETGQSAMMAGYPDRTVQVAGTLGGATVVLEGSNDGTNYFPLTKPGNTAISFTAAGGCAIIENPAFIRPKASGGTAAHILVTISGR
jgi:hypothetical protein